MTAEEQASLRKRRGQMERATVQRRTSEPDESSAVQVGHRIHAGAGGGMTACKLLPRHKPDAARRGNRCRWNPSRSSTSKQRWRSCHKSTATSSTSSYSAEHEPGRCCRAYVRHRPASRDGRVGLRPIDPQERVARSQAENHPGTTGAAHPTPIFVLMPEATLPTWHDPAGREDRTSGKSTAWTTSIKRSGRACVKAGVPHWSSHQLRHLA